MELHRDTSSATAGVRTKVVPFLCFAARGDEVELAVPDAMVTIVAIQESIPRSGMFSGIVAGKIDSLLFPYGVTIGYIEQSACFVRNGNIESRADTDGCNSRCAKSSVSELSSCQTIRYSHWHGYISRNLRGIDGLGPVALILLLICGAEVEIRPTTCVPFMARWKQRAMSIVLITRIVGSQTGAEGVVQVAA